MNSGRTPRNDMVHSAIQLFREKGIEATKLTDVTTHSNAPRGSIYHYFPDGKQQLAEEATRLAGTTMDEMLSIGLTETGPVPTLKAVIALFRGQLTTSYFTAGCPVAAASLGGENYRSARLAADESFTSWEVTIAAALWRRGIDQGRAQSLATAALAMIEGALLLCQAQRSTRALDRVETELITTVEGLIH